MSMDIPDFEQRRKDNLDRLYELHEELQTIAEADLEYARYARNALDRLEAEGYDVE